jgi:hypothetical protein
MARQSLLTPLPAQQMVAKRLQQLQNRMLERLTGADVDSILDDVVKRAKDGDQKAAEFVLTKLVGFGQPKQVVMIERPLPDSPANGKPTPVPQIASSGDDDEAA